VLLKGLFWGSLGALAWTHAGYPLAAGALARLRQREVARADVAPHVTVIVPAHDEEQVIGRRLENLLALDYPADRLEILVASDASSDRTDEIVAGVAATDARARLLRCPRVGKVGAVNLAARGAASEVLAFSDANTTWARDALAKLVRSFADPEVGYVCGRLELEPSGGTNRESVYWRYELWLREQESALGSITCGNGAIYAVRREDYVEDRFGHDLGFPHRMVKRGRRAVYDSDAVAFEKPSRDLADEYRRKVRMLPWDWQHLLEGRMLRGVGPLYSAELASHRVLRYSSGLLHIVLLGTSVGLAPRGRVYRIVLAGQLGFGALAAAGRKRVPVPAASLAYYYVLVTWATVAALARYLHSGVPPVWEHAEGSR
jgi:glycosyltransferase involved in cell wall biosynthesis